MMIIRKVLYSFEIQQSFDSRLWRLNLALILNVFKTRFPEFIAESQKQNKALALVLKIDVDLMKREWLDNL